MVLLLSSMAIGCTMVDFLELGYLFWKTWPSLIRLPGLGSLDLILGYFSSMS